MPLDPNIDMLLQMMAASGAPPLSQGSAADARTALRTLMVDLRPATAVIEVGEVEDGTVAGSPVRVYRPQAGTPAPTVVYFHGGGFVIGDLDTHDGVCRRLCRDLGAVVVSVDYPLAPEHRFPAAGDACWAVLQDVAAHVDDYGSDAARLVVGGDSAGGNLAAVCAQRARDADLRLAAQLLVYPAVDFVDDYESRTTNGEGYFLTADDLVWFAANYTGIEGGQTALADPAVQQLAADPALSPLRGNLEGLAPAVVATAEFDPLRDEGNAYADALAAAGVQVEHRQFAGLIHGFYGLEYISPAVADATEWINAKLGDLLSP